MRKFILAVALLLGITFIIAKLAEVQAILETLRRGDLSFILLAVVVQVAWLLNTAASYRSIYHALDIDERIGRLALMAAAANFINVVAPSVGVGGMAVFISEAKRREYSAARVTVAGVLFVLFEYAAFLSVLSLGLFVLFKRNHLTSAEVIATIILVGVALTLATLMILGMRSAQALGNALAWMARGVNGLLRPLIHRKYLSEERAHEFAHEAAEALRSLPHRPKTLVWPAVLALSSKGLLVTVLLLMFFAFKVPFSIGTLIAGFSIGYLFLIVSPTPAGIGVVEGALTLGLRSLNVPLSDAAVLALAYRGVTFWLPMLFGMIAFRRLSGSPAPKVTVYRPRSPLDGLSPHTKPRSVEED